MSRTRLTKVISKLTQISDRLPSVDVLSIAVVVEDEMVAAPENITLAEGDPVAYQKIN